MQPQGQLGDLDRRGIDINAVNTFGQKPVHDILRRIWPHSSTKPAPQGFDAGMLIGEIAQGRHQEGPGAAGRIDQPQPPQRRFIAIQRRKSGRKAIDPARLRFHLSQPWPDGFRHNRLHHALWRIINAIALALRYFANRWTIIEFRLADFKFGNRLLENMAQCVEIETLARTRGGEIIAMRKIQHRVLGGLDAGDIAPLACDAKHVIGHKQVVDFGIRGKQPAVEALHAHVRAKIAAMVHDAEQARDFPPDFLRIDAIEPRFAFGIEQIAQQLRWKTDDAAAILAIQYKQQAVENALRQPQQPPLAAWISGIVHGQRIVELFAQGPVFGVKIILDLFLRHALPGDKPAQGGCTALAEQKIPVKHPRKYKAAEIPLFARLEQAALLPK